MFIRSLLLILLTLLSQVSICKPKPIDPPVEPEKPDYIYTIADGQVTITGYRGTQTELDVPATLEGKPVTAIGNSAFANNGGITSVVLPSSVKAIGESAFQGCAGLASISLGEGLERIEGSAFANTALQAMEFPASLGYVAGDAITDNPSLAELYFRGDAPQLGGTPMSNSNDAMVIHYDYGTQGWEDTWSGYPTFARGAPEPEEPEEPEKPEPVEFTTPTHIADPQNDDEIFTNYQLNAFAPSTEPLLEEALDALAFEQESIWHYESCYSHTLGFATTRPSLTIVEYGDTESMGSISTDQQAYYYQHLHYLTGLEPGKTYFYRMHALDQDGNRISSDIGTFDTLPLDGMIRIPQDMPEQSAPYKLTVPGGKYLLTEDITSDTQGICIMADDVELDLGGHTIIYDNGTHTVVGKEWNDYAYDNEASCGIRVGVWNRRNVQLYNGTVKQGANGGNGFQGFGFNPILMYSMGDGTSNVVAGLTLDYYGDSIHGMLPNNGHVHHNVIRDRGSVVDNRHTAIRAIQMGQSKNNVVEYNSVRRMRHQGITGRGHKLHNEVYSDSFAINSFLVSMVEGDQARYNKLFGMGYHPTGFNWKANTVVSDNIIYLHGYAPSLRDTEYKRLSTVAGIRLTDYDGGSTLINNILYEDNLIVCKAYEGCEAARCVWVSSGELVQDVYFCRNVLKVEAMTDKLDYNHISSSFATVEINGRSNSDYTKTQLIFEDNTMMSNAQFINFGTDYGVGSSAWFYRSKLERINEHDANFRPLRLGYYRYNTTNNRIIDSICGEGVDLEAAPKYFGTTGLMEVALGRSHTATFLAADGSPLANTSITAVSALGEYSFGTDENGSATFDVLTLQHSKNGTAAAEVKRPSGYTFRSAAGQSLELPLEDIFTMDSIAMQ